MSQQFYPIFVRGPLSKAYIKVFGLTRDILLSPLTGSQRYAQNPEEISPQGIIPPTRSIVSLWTNVGETS